MIDENTVQGCLGISVERSLEVNNIIYEVFDNCTHYGEVIEMIEARDDLSSVEKIMSCMMFGGFKIYSVMGE